MYRITFKFENVAEKFARNSSENTRPSANFCSPKTPILTNMRNIFYFSNGLPLLLYKPTLVLNNYMNQFSNPTKAKTMKRTSAGVIRSCVNINISPYSQRMKLTTFPRTMDHTTCVWELLFPAHQKISHLIR